MVMPHKIYVRTARGMGRMGVCKKRLRGQEKLVFTCTGILLFIWRMTDGDDA
jgi:hypothetical protein